MVVQWVYGEDAVIAEFRDSWLKIFFVEDIRAKRIPADLENSLFRKLQLLDDATTEQDLRVPPGNHFEHLKGNLRGYCSVRVNQQWRLIFRWDNATGEASDVYLDPHRY